MQRSCSSAARIWKLLLVILGAFFISLVLFSPIYAIYTVPPVDSSQNQARLANIVQFCMPVIIQSHFNTTPSAGIPLITEVLYNPAGREPDGEWVEIYNAGGSPVDLAGYKIGDQSFPGCCEGMLAFPDEVILNPGDVIVVAYKAAAFKAIYGFSPDYEMESSDPAVPVLTRYTDWAERGVELTNTGDELLLLDPNNQLADAVSWGTSKFAFDPSVANVPEGFSLERYPPTIDTDTALDWRRQGMPQPGVVDLSRPTPTPSPTPYPTAAPSPAPTLIPTPFAGKLLLSEFLVRPLGIEPDGEWIEIYNAGATPLSLEDFKIGDEELRGGNESMLGFPDGAVLQPGQAVVVAYKGAAFFSAYGYFPDYEVDNSVPSLPDMRSYPVWGTANLGLSNQGDELLILDGRDQVIDAVSYGDSTYFFTPSIPLSAAGCSLERFPADQDQDRALDWREQCQPSPGTPAMPPPIIPPSPTPVPTLVINEIHAGPDLIYGDANGDGVLDAEDDEFIEIVNLTGSTVDLGGWCLWDERACRHEFPSPSLILNGCSVVVFGGGVPEGGFGGSLVQVSSDGVLSLNDLEDTLTLCDAAGDLALTLTYQIGGEAQGQSINRWPDITGEDFIPHMTAPEADGKRFSPGTLVDGSSFPGCTISDGYYSKSDAP
jgi:hypothetical protein